MATNLCPVCRRRVTTMNDILLVEVGEDGDEHAVHVTCYAVEEQKLIERIALVDKL